VIGLALGLPQAIFFTKDQAIDKHPHGNDHEEPAQAAGHDPNSCHHRQIREVQGITNIAIRAVGHQRFGMLADVVNHLGAQISGRPGAKKRRQEDQERAASEDQTQPEVSPGAVGINRGCDPVQQADREIQVIDRAQAERNENKGADHPEVLFEFEFRSAH